MGRAQEVARDLAAAMPVEAKLRNKLQCDEHETLALVINSISNGFLHDKFPSYRYRDRHQHKAGLLTLLFDKILMNAPSSNDY